MTLRCILDGLLLPANFDSSDGTLTIYDGDECFDLEAIEAIYYEVVTASPDELTALENKPYRLLKPAEDFRFLSLLRM